MSIEAYDPDIVYFNINMTGQPNEFVEAFFEETRNIPIINNPSDFYLSVIRFSVDTSTIPIFVCPVIENPLDSNDVHYTPFFITLRYNGVEYTENVRFVPSANFPPPQSFASINQYNSSYYYIYSYSRFLGMFNTAINDALNQIKAVFVGLTVEAPYYYYDSKTNLISLYVPNVENPLVPGTNVYMTQFYTTPPDPLILEGQPKQFANQPIGTIYMYENSITYSYVDGIEQYFNFDQNILRHLIIVRDLKQNYSYPPQNAPNTSIDQIPIEFIDTNVTYTTGPEWFKFTQETPQLARWNSINSLVFTTSTIPIEFEKIPGSSIVSSSASGISNFRSILSDFIPPFDNNGFLHKRYTYNVSGPYRLIELKSHFALRKIDLRIFWEDQLQNLYPVFIPGNSSNTIKLMFIKKSLVKSTNMLY